jgi:hypothetical protein
LEITVLAPIHANIDSLEEPKRRKMRELYTVLLALIPGCKL